MATSADLLLLTFYYVALVALAIFGVHRFHLVQLRRSFGEAEPTSLQSDWPAVTVQLPVYNEPTVIRRLIEAAAAIDYPGHLEIQILDDSTDQTTAIIESVMPSLCLGPNMTVTHIRRHDRGGFKAGALAAGMEQTANRYFAIFDADFVPHPQTLRQMMPHFSDPEVGMVQARWGHLNRTDSILTRVQAIYLDSHFAIESAARHLSDRFFNFNGTAGIWRREAIESAGGWSASTLTEDLDLSYRAQLAGWRFVFVPRVEIQAELPAALAVFQDQQHRWAKGSVQTARKVLPRILRSNLPLRVKIEALFHLTNNSAYLLTLMVALLLVPAILIRQRLGMTWMLLLDALLFAASSLSVLWFYLEGQRLVSRPRPAFKVMFWLLPLGIGISVRNASAVLEGLFQSGGTFRRTQKQGDGPWISPEKPPRVPVAEIILTLFFAAVLWSFLSTGQYASVPFVLLFLAGYGYVAFLGLFELAAFGMVRRETASGEFHV